MSTAEGHAHVGPDPWTLRAVRGLTLAWVFALVLALYPYTQNPAAPLKDLITGWAVVTLVAVYLVGMLRHGLTLRVGSSVLVMVAALFGWLTVTGLVSDYPLNSLHTARPWIVGVVLAVVVGNAFQNDGQRWRLLEALVLAVALSSVYGYLQRLGLDPFPWAARNIEEYLGMPSTYANPNFAGHTLIPAVFLALGVCIYRRRWLGGTCLVLIASHLYLTDMRAGRVAVLGTLAVMALFLFLARRYAARPQRAVGVALSLLLLAGAVAVPAGLAWLGTRGDTPLPIDSALILRLNGYYGAARMALERPALGSGAGNYELETPRYWTDFEQRWYATEGRKNDHVHNETLEFFVDGGLVAAGLYLAGLLVLIAAGWSIAAGRGDSARRGLGGALAAAMVAFAIDAQFGFNLRVPVSAGLFFVVVGLLHGLLPGAFVPRGRALAFQSALLLVALAGALASTAAFHAATRFHAARGAQAYAIEARDQGNSVAVEQAYLAALATLAEGERWQPFDSAFAEAAGQVCLALGRGDLAVEAYRRALSRNPYLPALHIGVAQGLISQALERDAMNLLGDAPDAPVLEYVVPAEVAAQQAIQIAPRYAPAHEVLGHAAKLRAKHAPADAVRSLRAAQTHFARALRYGTPSRAKIHQAMAEIGEALQDVAGATASYQQLLLAAPGDAAHWDALEQFAQGHAISEHYIEILEDALRSLRTETEVNASLQDDLAVRLAHAHLEIGGDAALAASLAQVVVARNPARADAWALVDYAVDASPEADDRVPNWVRGLAAGEGDVTPLLAEVLAAARADVAAGHGASALRYTYAEALPRLEARIRATLSGLPYAQALAGLAEVAAIAQQWALVDAWSAEVLPALPPAEAATPARLRVQALAALDRGNEALEAAREAVRLDPGAPASKWLLAQQLLAHGRLAEARFEYQDLLRRADQGTPELALMQLEAAQVEARLADSLETTR